MSNGQRQTIFVDAHGRLNVRDNSGEMEVVHVDQQGKAYYSDMTGQRYYLNRSNSSQ